MEFGQGQEKRKFQIFSARSFWIPCLFLHWTAYGAPTPSPGNPPTLSFLEERSPYSVTVIPNPARGKKVTFRVQTNQTIKVKVRIYDRFLDKVIDLEKEGDKLFDLQWPLRGVSEGIYYFQAQIIEPKTQEVTPLPIQKFLVLKGTPPSRK